MNMRVRRLWAPLLLTDLISASVQFVALRVPQLPPWVFFTRNGVSIVLAPLWMLALPFIGALGAWLSLRAGGNTRDRLNVSNPTFGRERLVSDLRSAVRRGREWTLK